MVKEEKSKRSHSDAEAVKSIKAKSLARKPEERRQTSEGWKRDTLKSQKSKNG